MNTYTIDPPKPESTAASAPTPTAAPVYHAPSTYQYPRLELAATPVPTPMVAPMYMPPTYQYPNLESTATHPPMVAPVYMPSTYQYPQSQPAAVAAPAPMVAPVYMPSIYQQPPYHNPVTSNEQQDINKIRDWLAWSIISLFLGGLIPGFLPLVFTLICRSKKSKNDLHGARKMSTLALVFNIVMTSMGVLVDICLFVYLVIYTQFMKNNVY